MLGPKLCFLLNLHRVLGRWQKIPPTNWICIYTQSMSCRRRMETKGNTFCTGRRLTIIFKKSAETETQCPSEPHPRTGPAEARLRCIFERARREFPTLRHRKKAFQLKVQLKHKWKNMVFRTQHTTTVKKTIESNLGFKELATNTVYTPSAHLSVFESGIWVFKLISELVLEASKLCLYAGAPAGDPVVPLCCPVIHWPSPHQQDQKVPCIPGRM